MKKKLLTIILAATLTLSPTTIVCADKKDDRIAELEAQVTDMQETIDKLEKELEETKKLLPTPTPTKAPVDDSVPAEYRSALAKAESYSKTMYMSKQGIYDQLTSEYGEQFSAEAAQYAIDNIQADWNANALAKAESYQSDMNMSPEAIREQLTSEYGEQFTAEEADYAIQHLSQ